MDVDTSKLSVGHISVPISPAMAARVAGRVSRQRSGQPLAAELWSLDGRNIVIHRARTRAGQGPDKCRKRASK